MPRPCCRHSLQSHFTGILRQTQTRSTGECSAFQVELGCFDPGLLGSALSCSLGHRNSAATLTLQIIKHAVSLRPAGTVSPEQRLAPEKSEASLKSRRAEHPEMILKEESNGTVDSSRPEHRVSQEEERAGYGGAGARARTIQIRQAFSCAHSGEKTQRDALRTQEE
ncbi:hypothetical protein FQA47_020040 [Oryzias melastigma]|uniref:Uncharacterized protein n=1 Tax=Oryzias melastigma TaxID=30732 RepID=A0A834CQF7_ORYME|nr:hypothetical protein FQA47_020040 [Oryzias melastigma]